MTNADEPPSPRNARLLTDEEVEARRPVLLEGIGQFDDGYFFQMPDEVGRHLASLFVA